MLPPGEALRRKRERGREWARKNREQNHVYYRKWYFINGRNRAIDYQEAIVEWAKNNPLAIPAHKKVSNALRTKKIIKPLLCSSCNMERKLVAHHEDYNRPLDVLWLCYSCHKLKHQITY